MKNNRHSLLLPVLILLIGCSTNKIIEAQTYFEVFNVNYSFSPNNKYKNSDATSTITDMNTNFKVP